MKKILLMAIFVLFNMSCLKDDVDVIKNNTTTIKTELSVIAEEEQLPRTALRAGITPAPVMYRRSLSINHYLVGQRHDWFNNVDSVIGRKTSLETAMFSNGIEVANYNITLYFNDGTTKYFENYLHEFLGEIFNYVPNTTTQLMHTSSAHNMVSLIQDRNTLQKISHKFRTNIVLSNYQWNVFFDDEFSHIERLLPPAKSTNAWNPGHSF